MAGRRGAGRLVLVGVVSLWFASVGYTADLSSARKLFNSGQYVECVAACDAAVKEVRADEEWWVLKMRSELATGQYPQALETLDAATDAYQRSIPILLVGFDVYREPQAAAGAVCWRRSGAGGVRRGATPTPPAGWRSAGRC